MLFRSDRELTRVRIKPVSIRNRLESFEEKNWSIDVGEGDQPVYPLDAFRVFVKIERHGVERDLRVPLVMAGPQNITSRIELKISDVAVRVKGDKASVEKITPADLCALVVVDFTEQSLPQQGSFQLTDLHCIVRNEALARLVEVILMPDVHPDNRQVEARVIPK